MLREILSRPVGTRQTFGAGLLATGMAAVVGVALAFETIGGYMPCALCLQQRVPYYVAIPVALTVVFGSRSASPVGIRGALLLVALAMAVASALGMHHAAIEAGLLAGPAGCSIAASFDMTGSLLTQLETTRAPSCSEPALLVLGLSLAVWNAILAAGLCLIALRAATTGADRFATGPSATRPMRRRAF